MPQRASTSSSLMRPFVVLALPGMYLLYKYNQYRQQQMETARRRVTERELMHLNTKIDKLLNKLEENEPELATSPEEECVICVNAKATMQTSPCGHRVVCRRCFVKTIQMAVSQRLLPLRCVICRAKILRLRQAPRLVTSKSWQVSSGSGRSWGVPGSVSSYSVGARSVPASASLYSVTSGESSLSGVSSVSSNSGGNVASACSTKLCGGAKCGGACLGAIPRVPQASTPPRPRQPASNSLRRSQHHSMKARLQEYQVHSYTGGPVGEPSGRLPPIREFQREFREGRRESAAAVASTSTRIRCAQKIVTQLETSPQKDKQHFFRPLKPSNNDDPPPSRDQSKETERKKDNPKSKPKKDDKKKKDDDKSKHDDKNKKDESSDNRKNEIAERKKEEKLRLKAEKEAKKEAKQQAKEEERQAKLLAKEEERQAKLLAKEEKKKAKKEAKLAAQAEKEKSK
ncbi:pre-mRNA-splicing factor CWC22 homolog isoform X2 [Manduca sexta]|uniref:pre-mRNA-splicing factor CWC22 homolog isoform X2 n=1 Tax=Manduca sexta TaxID=7130 RepID=UPI0018907DEA|nr:pre-mRNA-splicing factor CWC22 homolog isoform X2 [Manduca sexta]